MKSEREKEQRSQERLEKREEESMGKGERECVCVGGNETGQVEGDGKKGSVERQSQKLRHFLR